MRRYQWLVALSVCANIALVSLYVAGVVGNVRGNFPLLAGRIFSQSPNDVIINFTTLRTTMNDMINAQKDMHLGVYFEYLPSGTSIGINSKDEFISASLLKVPLIMGVYKLMEDGTLDANRTLKLTQQDLDPNFGSLWKRGAGATISVQDAIALALTESDNTAALALDDATADDQVRRVYNALDIPIDWQKDEPVVSAQNYASVFRCLYLSCFLSYDGSEKILDLLSRTIFKEGITAGVPENVLVAHKIGVYDAPNSTERVRLDCGIVYAPHRPYVLCVLGQTQKGKELEINDFTEKISGAVYAFVSAANK